jgi:hypothetical protein
MNRPMTKLLVAMTLALGGFAAPAFAGRQPGGSFRFRHYVDQSTPEQKDGCVGQESNSWCTSGRPQADEVINVFGLAIRHNLTADDLKTTMFAYPTGASDIGFRTNHDP